MRPILYRACLCDMVVPYGDPGELSYRKNAFDIGEYGIGQFANQLMLGCDYLGHIRYFDAHMAGSRGNLLTIQNAVCLHEENDAILWKHTDWCTKEVEVRRSRRLVVWYTFGRTHISRPEDWPVMPVHKIGFMLPPDGFFDANPAMDLSPSPSKQSCCHE